MKLIARILLLLPLLMGFSASNIAAEGIEFFHGTWEEALEMAAAEDKLIFVDAYTTWCGPCKRMAATVFTQEEVGAFYNENFVCMKIDMEKEAGIRFQQKYPVAAYPTLYYIDGAGKTVHQSRGAQPAVKLISMGQMVLGKVDKSGDYAKEYEAGNRDPELVLKYVKALVKAGKPSGKVANEYINSQKDLTTDFNLRFLLAATVEADSRIFDKLAANRERAAAVESQEAVSEVMKKACERTVKKAINFNTPDLVKEAKEKMERYLPKEANTFAYRADMNYAKATENVGAYLKACRGYAKKVVKNNAAGLHEMAKDIHYHFDENNLAMNQAEKYAKQAAENGGLAEYYITYSRVLLDNLKKAEALVMAKKSLELAKGDTRQESIAIQLIRLIEREG